MKDFSTTSACAVTFLYSLVAGVPAAKRSRCVYSISISRFFAVQKILIGYFLSRIILRSYSFHINQFTLPTLSRRFEDVFYRSYPVVLLTTLPRYRRVEPVKYRRWALRWPPAAFATAYLQRLLLTNGFNHIGELHPPHLAHFPRDLKVDERSDGFQPPSLSSSCKDRCPLTCLLTWVKFTQPLFLGTSR